MFSAVSLKRRRPPHHRLAAGASRVQSSAKLACNFRFVDIHRKTMRAGSAKGSGVMFGGVLCMCAAFPRQTPSQQQR